MMVLFMVYKTMNDNQFMPYSYFYQDSLVVDSLYVYMNDSINQNKIKSRNIKYKITIPVISNTLTIIKNKNEFYAGIGLVGSQNGINYFV